MDVSPFNVYKMNHSTITITNYANNQIFPAFISDVGQHTTPPDLPIFGDPYTDIALELIFPKGNPIFILNGKQLQLLRPLDRDEENLSHIVFQVCLTFGFLAFEHL